MNAIPEQHSGNQHDAVESLECNSLEEALRCYNAAVERLKKIHAWGEIVNDMEAVHYDNSGSLTKASPEVGNYIRTVLPGPGNPDGDGNDWVKIQEIHESPDQGEFLMTVKPCNNPLDPDTNIAHFYDDQASNTFIIRRQGTTVFAEVHGRNEKPNLSEASLMGKARNALVGLGGIIGLGKIHWEYFAKRLLEQVESSK
jgi:hypothetical protein